MNRQQQRGTSSGFSPRQRGASALRLVVGLAALALVAAVGYLLLQPTPSLSPPLSAPPVEAPPAPSAPAAEPLLTQERLQQVAPPEQVESPPDGRDNPPLSEESSVATPAAAPKLPSLNGSDGPFRQALLALDPTALLADLLINDELIRKFVVTVDNMAEGRLPPKHALLQGPGEPFKATEAQGGLWLDGFNYGRYGAYVQLLNQLDSADALRLYQRYYPLMQQAYAELGYPRRAFHDRVLLALDHLLQSPRRSQALELEQPSVMYKFSDPQLEQLSAVHKQMLRMGPRNAEQVLAKARELRAALGRWSP